MKGRAPQPQRPPWWSDADQAEYDLLIAEFVGSAFAHRERCSTCRAGGPWCAALTEAFDALEEWRAGRELRSKAAHLRAAQDFADWKAAA